MKNMKGKILIIRGVIKTVLITILAAPAIGFSDADPVFHNNKGIEYYERGYMDRALDEFFKAIELGFESAILYNNIGMAYYQKSDYAAAIENFLKAVEIDPEYKSAYNQCGFTYFQAGDYDKAVAYFTNAITLDPGFAIAYKNRGFAYGKMGKYLASINDFGIYLILLPDAPDAKNLKNEIDRLKETVGLSDEEPFIRDERDLKSMGDLSIGELPAGDDSGVIMREFDYDEGNSLREAPASLNFSKKPIIDKFIGEKEINDNVDSESSTEKPEPVGDISGVDAHEPVTLKISEMKVDTEFPSHSAWRRNPKFDAGEVANIELPKEDAFYHKYRGIIDYNRGNFDSALENFSKAIEIDLQYANAYKHRALTYAEKGESEKSADDFNMYLKLSPAASDAVEIRRILQELSVK